MTRMFQSQTGNIIIWSAPHGCQLDFNLRPKFERIENPISEVSDSWSNVEARDQLRSKG
jgi:hypothetical protein